MKWAQATDAGSAHRRYARCWARYPAGSSGHPRGAPVPPAALGAVFNSIGLTVEPGLGGSPLVPGSARDVPAWILAGPVIQRVAALLRHSRRSFVEHQETRFSPPRPSAVADVDLHPTAARRVDPIPLPLLGTRKRPGSPGQREEDPLSPGGGVVACCLMVARPHLSPPPKQRDKYRVFLREVRFFWRSSNLTLRDGSVYDTHNAKRGGDQDPPCRRMVRAQRERQSLPVQASFEAGQDYCSASQERSARRNAQERLQTGWVAVEVVT